MQASDLIRFSRQPAAMTAADVEALQKLIGRYPYFESAHLLLSIAAKRLDEGLYQATLPRTAATVTSRAHLFRKVNAPFTLESEAAPVEQVQQPLEETTAIAQGVEIEAPQQHAEPEAPEVVPAAEDHAEEQLEKEIGRQVVAAFVEKEILRTPEVQAPRRDEAGSFGDWLAYLKKNNGQPYAEIEVKVNEEKSRRQEKRAGEAESRKKKHLDIIDRIIATNPGPIRGKEEKFYTAESKAKESLLESEDLVTETLARIYALQGNTAKAIRAYEILSLRFPQKSAYFAGLILKLRNPET
jgi:hypothetical protein